jgi:hypothetical protein
LTDTTHDTHAVEAISPTLHLGAIGALRSTWLGPAWGALCGLVASGAFRFEATHLLIAAFVFGLADWAWPAAWTTGVRTDWLAPAARWRDVEPRSSALRLPYLQGNSPADRGLRWGARLAAWVRFVFAPMVGPSALSLFVAVVAAVVLSLAVGWRAWLLTLAALALVGIGALRAWRTAADSDRLRSIVYGTWPWWLGHAAFAPLTIESAALGVLFGFTFQALMGSDERAPSPTRLIAPQAAVALILFAGGPLPAAFAVTLALIAQAALRSIFTGHPYARRAQVWLMAAMLASAVAVA